ncbi:thiamine phosphate synthase [Convivina intestini]|uniref:Thiamine-phosphate synthase n=1 Tax=Convivina intestini TaxID=1505726 RepID=A0A2U1DEY5_9LACO|nr:thiamine phosphate synthase [Convivina intestini]PVY86230.1 thiamine-phosphate pyrophosphorylase [Convivina intestini]CAH1851305.1 Thiamine-phosphate synthase [Convivina intestini]CAH1851915.1 Thiamine-phosphate synthase [Convivina intestini]SDB81689.1 thiamine-phosphate pyrophosphorylase [Leuconostocaceae bacterium R-53105]
MYKFKPEMLNLYLVGGSQNVAGNQIRFLEILEQACQLGITAFQYREKDGSTLSKEEKINLGHQVRKITQQYQIPLIVDDDWQLAQKIGADGLHLGQSDVPLMDILPEVSNLILGLSVHDQQELPATDLLNQLDYLGVGPVYSTRSKTKIKTPIGLDGLKNVVQLTDKPIVAIGGIHPDNACAIRTTGVDGLAVISAIFNSSQLTQDISKLKES